MLRVGHTNPLSTITSRRTSEDDIRLIMKNLRTCLQPRFPGELVIEERYTPHGRLFDQDYKMAAVTTWLLMERYYKKKHRGFLFWRRYYYTAVENKFMVSMTKDVKGPVYVSLREESLLPVITEQFKHGGSKVNTISFRVAE